MNRLEGGASGNPKITEWALEGINNYQELNPKEEAARNCQYLEAVRKGLSQADFIRLPGGDEWEVYVPTDSGTASAIPAEVTGREWRKITQEKVSKVPERKKIVLKAQRTKITPEGARYLQPGEMEARLDMYLANQKQAREIYGPYLVESLYWIGPPPPNLPEAAENEPPSGRAELASSEKPDVALLCVQPFVDGINLEDYLRGGGEITPEIESFLETFIDTLRRGEDIIDLTSLGKDNVIVDHTGTPRLIDATLMELPEEKIQRKITLMTGVQAVEQLTVDDLIQSLIS